MKTSKSKKSKEVFQQLDNKELSQISGGEYLPASPVAALLYIFNNYFGI